MRRIPVVVVTGRDPQKTGPVNPTALRRERERAERRAQALRDNLKRRKRQIAARAETSAAGDEAGEDPAAGDEIPDSPFGPARGGR